MKRYETCNLFIELEVPLRHVVLGVSSVFIESSLYVACRSREAELERLRQTEVANIEADNLQKTQEMLAEFSHAQQILKDKIRQLQNM